MNECAEPVPSNCGWMRRHSGRLWLALAAGILAILCTTGRPDGLTTYVMFFLVLTAAGILRFAGGLVRLPELGAGFAVGGIMVLVVTVAVIYRWHDMVIDKYGPSWARRDVVSWASVGSLAMLWFVWAFYSVCGDRFWKQLARASGLCWGGFLVVIRLNKDQTPAGKLRLLADFPGNVKLELHGGFDDRAMPHVAAIGNLMELSLFDAEITDAGLANLKYTWALVYLDLSNTRTTDHGLKHVAGLKWLETIDLRNTQITDKGLACLATLPELVTVWLSKSQCSPTGSITPGGIAAMKQAARQAIEVGILE